MRGVIGAVLAGSLVAPGAWAAASAGQVVPLHSQDVRHDVTQRITSLTVTGDTSRITLRRGASFSVVAHEEWNLRQPELQVVLDRGALRVTISCSRPDVEAGLVAVSASDSLNDCTDDLALTVPAGVPVRARTDLGDVTSTGLRQDQQLTTGAGDVTVRDATGDLVLKADDGEVVVAGATGSVVEARSGSGRVRLSDVTARRRAVVTADDGTVRLDHVTAQGVSVSSNAGDVTTSEVRGSAVSLRTANGAVSARRLTAGTVDLVTSSGSIDADLVDAPSFVSSYTGNGSIALSVPHGRYDVATDSQQGAVRVTGLVDDPRSRRHLRAQTGSGDITLTGR